MRGALAPHALAVTVRPAALLSTLASRAWLLLACAVGDGCAMVLLCTMPLLPLRLLLLLLAFARAHAASPPCCIVCSGFTLCAGYAVALL